MYWLMILVIVMAVIAAFRGWGLWPIVILGVAILFWPIFSNWLADLADLTYAQGNQMLFWYDLFLIAIFATMAIKRRNKPKA